MDPVLVKGYDFNDGIDYHKLLQSYRTSGFQATNFGIAVEVINKMVRVLILLIIPAFPFLFGFIDTFNSMYGSYYYGQLRDLRKLSPKNYQLTRVRLFQVLNPHPYSSNLLHLQGNYYHK